MKNWLFYTKKLLSLIFLMSTALPHIYEHVHTTTLVSTVLSLILQMPWLGMSCICKTCVSASSHVQGAIKQLFYGLLQATVSLVVYIFILLSLILLLAMGCGRKWNNSERNWFIRRKTYQFFGGYKLFSTFL